MTLKKLKAELAELYQKQADLANRLDLENAAIEDLNAAIAENLINGGDLTETEELQTRRVKLNGLVEAVKIVDTQILEKKDEINRAKKTEKAEQLQEIHDQAEQAAADMAAGYEQAIQQAYTLIKLRKQARLLGGAFSDYESRELSLGMADLARYTLKGLEKLKTFYKPAAKKHAELWRKLKHVI